jgi:lysyl-tRNA synthetase, class II
MSEENHLIQERVRKLDELREMGINPYPYTYKITKHSKQIKEENSGLPPETKTEKHESVAGRIMLFRKMGKASFMTLQDDEGQIQAYIRSDDIGEEKYELLKKLDLGDILGVKGKVFTTKTGEISIYADNFELLSKAIKPLPEKFHGLKDTEQKYRNRHLDLITSPESKEIFRKRLLIMQAIREYMTKHGFMEVETPILQELYGGAAARPFTTFHNDLKFNMYLRISPELYLKKLLVGGFEKVFDINKNFRNESIDTTHNPEFTMMEAYQAYGDYNDMMELIENLFEYVALKVLGTTKIMFKGQEVDVKAPWDKVSMLSAIEQYAGIDARNMSVSELEDYVITNAIEFDKELNWGNLVVAIYEEKCEHQFINPTHIIDHPRESTPLCKVLRNKYDDRLIERCEPMCMGMELGNIYSELNDPIVQRKLLEDQQRQLNEGNAEANPIDESFLDAIETGMPPAGGIGIGIDRMIMLLLGQESIRDIIFFPTMKPEHTQDKKEEKKE